MDQYSETESICSENSTTSKHFLKSGYLLLNPNDAILENRFESIIAMRCNNNFESIINNDDDGQIFIKFKQIKAERSNNEKMTMMYDLKNVSLTDEDRKLGQTQSDDDDQQQQFERVFGTAIDDGNINELPPYLELNLPLIEQRKRLNKSLLSHQSKDLQSKMTLTADIEQRLTIEPLRISRRQRKKIMKQERKKSLPQWFDMPQVKEISKETEKDLLALRMRRVWDAKQFYKKSSDISIVGGKGMNERSKYFQIGTIQETAADYYTGRLTRRQRKQSLMDELMSDAQLKAFNKRNIQRAMSRNSRLKIMMQRAKLRRMKRKIRERSKNKNKELK